MIESLGDGRQVRVVVFAASLRRDSLNERLAALAATVVGAQGAAVDRASMADFDCPSYNGDVEREKGFRPGDGACAIAWSRRTPSSSRLPSTMPPCRAA